MLKRLMVVALLLAGSAAGAAAQNPFALISSTAPAGDNSDRIATTAWVTTAIAAAQTLANGKVWIGNVSNVATAQTVTGDGTLSNAGALVVTKTNGTSFGALSTLTPAAGIATWLTTPSSANLAGALTDETGSGAAVFANSPLLVTPNLGTPSAVNLTNGTALPIAGISGLATGMATFLATPSSANLRGTLTDETGTGLAYFQGGDIGTPSAGVGSNLTALNATNISTGTLNQARLVAPKVVSSTIDISLTTNTALSCGGMTPRAGVFFAAVAAATGQVAFGLTDGTTAAEIHGRGTIATQPNYGTDTTVFDIIVDASNSTSFSLVSMDASGFTVHPTKAGSPTGTASIKYLCIS